MAISTLFQTPIEKTIRTADHDLPWALKCARNELDHTISNDIFANAIIEAEKFSVLSEIKTLYAMSLQAKYYKSSGLSADDKSQYNRWFIAVWLLLTGKVNAKNTISTAEVEVLRVSEQNFKGFLLDVVKHDDSFLFAGTNGLFERIFVEGQMIEKGDERRRTLNWTF